MSWNQEERKRVDVTENIAAYMDDDSLLPSIIFLSENEALVRYSYWNDWSGLVKAKVDVAHDDIGVRFSEPKTTVLVKYHCGIEF